MSKVYDKLLVPEAFSALRPYEFVVGILKCIRTTTSTLAHMLGLSLRNLPTRPYYRHVTVNVADIETVRENNVLLYTVTLPVSGLDVVGAMLSEPAIRGRDFTCDGYKYTFYRHPTYFGTVSSNAADKMLELVCVGGEYEHTLDPIATPYCGCTDTTTMAAIDDSIYNGAPMGLTARLLEAVAGARLSTDPIIDVWTEGDYALGVDEGGRLVYAPTASGIKFSVGNPVDLSAIVTPDINSGYFCAKLPDGIVVLSTGANALSVYPNIVKDAPGTAVVDGFFRGMDVLVYLLKNGGVFYKWAAITSNGQGTALTNYQVNPGKVVISVEAPSADTEVPSVLTNTTLVPVAGTITTAVRGYNCI